MGALLAVRLGRAAPAALVPSADAPVSIQAWFYEDRTGWPTPARPYRKSMTGERHMETVPVAVRR